MIYTIRAEKRRINLVNVRLETDKRLDHNIPVRKYDLRINRVTAMTACALVR